MAVLSLTDLPKSFLNPFLFPGSILLEVMNDLRKLLGSWKSRLLERALVVEIGRCIRLCGVCSCGGGQASRPSSALFCVLF